MQALRLVTAAAFVSALLLACGGGSPPDPIEVPNGGECAGDVQCVSRHCDPTAGICCDGAECCLTENDCPESYRSASICTSGCQGTREDATCLGFVCGTATREDDSGCAGAAHDCGAYRPIACTTSSDQVVPTCPTQCSLKSDCATGYACNGNHQCVPMVGAGETCDTSRPCGDGLKCDSGVCCDQSAGSCCSAPADCPAQYRAASTCTITGSGTACQGTARLATCSGNVCGTQTVQDDSGCAGQVHACGGYTPVSCSSATSQPEAVCATACSGDAGCAAGYRCTAASNGTCVPGASAGQTCTAWATQGTCGSALKCDNSLCCSASAAGRCCTSPTQCLNGLACSSYACNTSCTLNTSSGCASSSTYCTNGTACATKLGIGTSCVANGQCQSGTCYYTCCQPSSCGTRCGTVSNDCGATINCGLCPCPSGTSRKCPDDDLCYAPGAYCR